jgi:hypothetical protein
LLSKITYTGPSFAIEFETFCDFVQSCVKYAIEQESENIPQSKQKQNFVTQNHHSALTQNLIYQCSSKIISLKLLPASVPPQHTADEHNNYQQQARS